MTEKQKKIIQWIEENTDAKYEGGDVLDFIDENIEEARFNSHLKADEGD